METKFTVRFAEDRRERHLSTDEFRAWLADVPFEFATMSRATQDPAWVTGLVLDLIYYLAGALFVGQPRQYLRDLLTVPLYFAMWGRSLVIALFTRGRQLWLRAGRWKA